MQSFNFYPKTAVLNVKWHFFELILRMSAKKEEKASSSELQHLADLTKRSEASFLLLGSVQITDDTVSQL